ncbi:MAG: CvpA family protein [Verrucomicrobia bacterium]|nr:MAG: CvpA family protein [Verrucomicrobiota bacterium]
MNGFNAVDILALIWLLIGMWRGGRQGLAGALLRLLALGLAVGAGFMGYAWLAENIASTGRLAGPAGDLLSFFLITMIAYVLLRLVGLLLKNMMTFTFKGRLEPVGGGVVGLLISACVITLILLVAGQWPEPQMKKWFAEESWLGQVVQAQLGPAWRRLEQRYPALKLSEDSGAETLDSAETDTAKTVGQAHDAAKQKLQKVKKRVNEAVVERQQ